MEEPPKSPFSLVVIPETKDEPLKSPSLSVPSETMSKWPSLRGLVNDWQDLLGPTNENSEGHEDFDWSVSYFKSTNSTCFSWFLSTVTQIKCRVQTINHASIEVQRTAENSRGPSTKKTTLLKFLTNSSNSMIQRSILTASFKIIFQKSYR
ncbi:Uncharacterized protein APZ42_030011 [Daphnia magna]|uniref:Uncharacterized protein n=1 Tax=Daphnia magna TaxID=35525 RepID=A0A164P4S1_9CRUS|nr:Uncharacterized protein APZ42_030011 [Daphnia magna]